MSGTCDGRITGPSLIIPTTYRVPVQVFQFLSCCSREPCLVIICLNALIVNLRIITMGSPYRIPSGPHLHPTSATTPQARSSNRKKTWQPRLPFLPSRSEPQHDSEETLSREVSQAPTNASSTKEQWWRIRLFRGMINDVRRRAPFYGSDWRDAWDYRVIPATIYMYFVCHVHFPSFGFVAFRICLLTVGCRQSMSPNYSLIYQNYHACYPLRAMLL